jgi:RimJ/RimL family protein N-acetyltransferase
MLCANHPERRRTKEAPQEPVWKFVEITDPEALIGELLKFWGRQSEQDARNRFCSSTTPDEIRLRYRHALGHIRIALELRDEGSLIGFAIGTVDHRQPDWMETGTEVDFNYRGCGYGVEANELIYLYATLNGYAGLKCQALSENTASLALIAKLAKGKPHTADERNGFVIYYIGDQTKVPFGLDSI